MREGYKIRIYPNDEQKEFIHQSTGNVRFTWNQYLNMLNERYKNNSDLLMPSKFELMRLLPSFKEEFPFLKLSDASSLQFCVETLRDTFAKFFKRQCGYPKFKNKSYSESFTIKNNKNIKRISKSYIKLPKIGKLKCQPYNVKGRITKAIISYTSSGKYYLSIVMECESQTLPKTNEFIGIDLGLTHLAILSNGEKYKLPKYHNIHKTKRIQWEKKTARRCRLAKERLGKDWRQCKNYQKARQMVAKYREKEANQRHDYLHKLSKLLVERFDIIVLEDLKTSNLMKNHNLSESIMRSAWRTFRTYIKYKCVKYGKQIIIINPSYTSQQCSHCGHLDGKKTLEIRNWTCSNCGALHDRDINAAINILNKGLATL